jgi:ribosomal protein L35AE/L33A
MSQQIQITGGAKVRNLDGVLTGTSGVVNSLPINASNGIPQLDVNGKILVSQLPNSVMEYQGTWNVSTNTPTLANGTGNQGDVYLVEGAAVGGTAFNFGAGPITFFNGDQAIYSGSIWQRASGATGTVTSVAITESGDSLNITGSPITTSGTINIGFNGTNLQYVNGAGNLTTFPTLITSIGLSMPSAFSVANSPLTANGTIAVTGAGTTAQYIRGDGSLATFPTIATEAQRLITEVYNETGATLTKGTVVYINGGHGNLPTITKAIATGDATSAQTYGIVQADITDMNNGYVVVIGSLGDLDTQAYANGTQLYLSSTTAGAWTDVKQYAPAHLVYVGIVVRSHPTQGVVEVRIQNGFEMDELHNVSAQSPLNNQGLFYNTST